MNILIGMPCFANGEITRQAIQSVSNCDLLLIDNGAEPSVKEVIKNFKATIIKNENNIYVNPARNQIIKWFLQNSKYDYLVIFSSDVVMQKNWLEILKNRWAVNPDEICIPTLTPDINYLNFDLPTSIQKNEVVENIYEIEIWSPIKF